VIPLSKPDDLANWVERSFGHVFAAPALCATALRHRSAGPDHNERLEFLGDSILNCAVARLLYDAHPQADEGDLSRLRASLVSGESLAQIAAELGLGEYMRLGPGELKSGGYRRASILADGLEAMLGAIFLDSGYEAAAAAVARLIGAKMSELPAAGTLKDPKTRLQEFMQARGLALPVYTLTAVGGDPHTQTFTVMCEIPVLGIGAKAEGGSRRRAEQLAAAKVIDLLPAEMRSS
jgi:ribonuclease III